MASLTEAQKWKKYTGNPCLVGPSWAQNTAAGEPFVIWTGSQFIMYYTAGWDAASIAAATSTDGINWTYHGTGAVIGGVSNAAGETLQTISRGSVYQESGTTYIYYANTDVSQKQLFVATSTDGFTFTKVGLVMSGSNYDTWEQAPANSQVIKVGSTYHMMLESFTLSQNPNFEMGHYTSSSPTGPFVKDGHGPLTALQYGSGMFGGPWVMPTTYNGVYHMWYHAAPTGATPTYIYHATTTDFITWTKAPAFAVLSKDTANYPFEFDQVADASVVEVNNKTYLFYSGVHNASSTEKIGVATFDGTIQELITNRLSGHPNLSGNMQQLTGNL